MEIRVQLYSILREKLPAEAKGSAVRQLEDGATLAELLADLGIERRVVVSVNDVQEPDLSRPLSDGDEVKIFASISGG
ncbi:MAG TPA: MoaD/ThiS family protein [Chloroflexi bacterium]|nr:MoaD/ThiS family protein [Chloroflexota bacterium]